MARGRRSMPRWQGRGLKPRFHKGLRVTDGEALECVKRAMGVTRIEIEALLSQGLPNTPLAGGFLRVTGGNFITGASRWAWSMASTTSTPAPCARSSPRKSRPTWRRRTWC